DGRTHEVVAIVDDQSDARMILFVHVLRVLRRNNDGALQFAITHVLDCLLLVRVVDRDEGADIGANGIEGLTDSQRLRTAVLVYESDPGVVNLSAERVAQDD